MQFTDEHVPAFLEDLNTIHKAAKHFEKKWKPYMATEPQVTPKNKALIEEALHKLDDLMNGV